MNWLEFFTGFIEISNNPIVDWIIGALLVIISGSIAYKIGGELGYSGKCGFILWLITAILVYAVFAVIIRFIFWLISIPWWIWLLVLISILIIIIIFILHKKYKKQQS